MEGTERERLDIEIRERDRERERERERVQESLSSWYCLAFALASFPQFDHPWLHPNLKLFGGVGLVCFPST